MKGSKKLYLHEVSYSKHIFIICSMTNFEASYTKRHSHLYFVIKSQDLWIWQVYLNMSVYYLKIEVT